MNTKDFKRIVNALPDDGYVGFEIADLPALFAKYEKIDKEHKGSVAIPIKIRDFEMNYIGDEDDEISVLTFELYRD
jgi:hypothetical protein